MKGKILIIGSPSVGATALSRKIADMGNVEIINIEQAAEMNIKSRPERIVVPIIAPPDLDMYFQPPLTRRERRAKQRKKY